MTNREKQKEFIVTVRSIIANENQVRDIDEICSMAKDIVDRMDDYYPEFDDDEYESNIKIINDSVELSIYSSLSRFIDNKCTTRTGFFNQLSKKGFSREEAWSLINSAIEHDVLVKGEKLKYKLVEPRQIPF